MRKNSSGNTGRQQETGKAIYSFMDAVAGEAEKSVNRRQPPSASLQGIGAGYLNRYPNNIKSSA